MIGIDPTSITPLTVVTEVVNAQTRFAAVAANWIEDHFGMDSFDWKKNWHYAPYALLAQAFTRDELIYIWQHSVLSSRLNDYLETNEGLTWKVQHALWRYGCSRDYQRFVACHNGLGRLTVNLPGFDVRITHTRSINTAAWATHGREVPEGCADNPAAKARRLIYLDASFGALLYYQGRHVMTIGFAPSDVGILVAQVQLREERGNRFLYKLPMPYLDFALDLLQRAFPDDELYFVTGFSTRRAIQAAYGKDAEGPSWEVMRRVERFYDQPLQNYKREKATIVSGSDDDGRMFVRLVPSGATVGQRAA